MRYKNTFSINVTKSAMKTPLLGPRRHCDMPIRTLDDLAAQGQTIGLRLDINSPFTDGSLADDFRIRAHLETVEELTTAGARVVVLAHQGRPGGDSFRCLEPHADVLDGLIDAPVDYIDSTFATAARDRISTLSDGEVLVLENTRFFSEEYIEFEPERAAQTYLVTKLAPVLDAYVDDAFAAAHRSQPSLVGFPRRIPSYAGRLMEREIDVLGTIESTARPRVYFLAGAKVPDSLSVAESVLEDDIADEVLAGGLFGNLLLHAKGIRLGEPTDQILVEFDALETLPRARRLLTNHGDRIRTPVDLAIEVDGERVEIDIDDLPVESPTFDIGSATIDEFGEALGSAATAVLNGPAGRVEDPLFTQGTRGVYRAASAAENSIVGGGDTGAVLRKLGIDGFDHVSTGGGAAMRMLARETLPAVQVLEDAG